MFRMKKCFCNTCSVRAGSRVILWYDLITHAISTAGGFAAFVNKDYEFFDYASYILLIWAMIELVIIIHAVIGLEQKRPSFIYPFILISEIKTVLLMLLIFLFLGELFLARHLIAEFIINISEDMDIQRKTVIVVLFVAAMIYFSALSYFSAIIYSHYKDLKEELKRGEGISISKTVLVNFSSDPPCSPDIEY